MNEAPELQAEGKGGLLDFKMPLTEHLGELRKRILVALSALLVSFSICFFFSEKIFNVLTMPMKGYFTVLRSYPYWDFIQRKEAFSLVFLSPTEAFWAHIKISMIAGVIISVPVIFHQFWKFISPGLLDKEKKYVAPFVFSGTALFLIGAGFCFLVILPFAIQFLLTYKTASLTPLISVGNYMDFCLKFILAFGIVFELPLIIVILTRMGVVTPEALAKKRKYAILLSFVVAAILTPTPDAFNQVLMAVPIILLYELGVLFSRIFVKKRRPNV